MLDAPPAPSLGPAVADSAAALSAVQQQLGQLQARYDEAEYMLLEKDRAIMDLRATVRRQAPLVEKAMAIQAAPPAPPPPPAAPPPPLAQTGLKTAIGDRSGFGRQSL